MGGKKNKERERARKRKRERHDSTTTTGDSPRGDVENRLAEAMTVAWMLSLLATLAAEVAGLLSWLVLWLVKPQGADGETTVLAMIPAVLFFVALVTGSCCLGLGLVVRRVRAEPPPQMIRRAAMLAGLAPWVVFLGLYLFGKS